jgi:hypothetical protein
MSEASLRETSAGGISLFSGKRLSPFSPVSPKAAINLIITSSIHTTMTPCFLVYLLALTILHQPLKDANSRTITAFINLNLMNQLSLSGPPLSIAPSFVTRPTESFNALVELYQESNWIPFLSLLKLALQEGLESKKLGYNFFEGVKGPP